MRTKKLEKEFIERINSDQHIIHKVCNLYCDNEEDRKDLFQDILINLWESYPSFKGNSKFTTWMYRVCLNIAIQRLRKVKRRDEYLKKPDAFDQLMKPNSENLPVREIELMYSAISQLNDIEKAIIMLYLEETSNEDIADIIGISQNYVRVKMTRIRKKLKQIVGR